jgi:hypothetical protein
MADMRSFPAVRRFLEITTRRGPGKDNRAARRAGLLRQRLEIERLETRLTPSTYVVLNTADSGDGSLRQAILDANAHPGPDTITFAVLGDGVQTIQPLSALPAVTDAVTIDGTTQPGYAGSPLIELDGHLAGTGANGLFIQTGNLPATVVIKALAIDRFAGTGISIRNSTSRGASVVIQGNRIGTDATGTQALGNRTGVDMFMIGAVHVTVGGTAAGAGNLISGNAGDGISILDGGSEVIQGNLIGTDATGTQALGNGEGILVAGSLNPLVTIGGTTANAGNLISGNHGLGIDFGHASAVVQGNLIGTDATGTQALGNGTGIFAFESITMGGTAAGAGNVISGNARDGIEIRGDANIALGNRIGTDITGTRPLGNGGNGVTIIGSSSTFGNTIGGSVSGAGNTISANGGDGIMLCHRAFQLN